MLYNAVTAAYPFIIVFAQATAVPFSWLQTLLVYGPLGLWVGWFVMRDKADREERKAERADQERRHQENLSAQKAVEHAFRTNTNSILIGISAMQHLDASYAQMLSRVKADNDGGK